jgi:predicted nuclease with TOPRIM domain
MKKPTTKIVGGLMVAILLTTIGAVLVGAETGYAGETEDWHLLLHHREKISGYKGFNPELSNDQQAEIDELISSLIKENASCDEIKEAIFAKLDEMGILDEKLDNAIQETEQRLKILERENELRDQGYSWGEISETIKEEFDLEYPSDIYGGFSQESCWNYNDSSEKELSLGTTKV